MARLNPNVFDLSGRGAIVTGGGTHLGAAMTRALATHGARVCIVGRRPEILADAVSELNADGLDVVSRVLDITDSDRVDQVVAEIAAELGGLSIMVCNAGASAEDRFPPDQPIQTFVDTLKSHLVGTFSCAQAAARSHAATLGSVGRSSRSRRCRDRWRQTRDCMPGSI